MSDRYNYQPIAVRHACEALRAGRNLLLASPTGTGKSYMELGTLAEFPTAALLTPRVEIAEGMLQKRGIFPNTEAELLREMEAARIFTPIRFRNRLLAGEMDPPEFLIVDEAHHDAAQSYRDIHTLCGWVPRVGFTATPYRGTPKGTQLLRELWGDPQWVITLPEAVERGVLSFPRCSIWPLIDDDVIEVSNGEFQISAIESATNDKLADIAERCRQFIRAASKHVDYPLEWDRPTMFSVPSTALAYSLAKELNFCSVPNNVVVQDTTRAARKQAFEDCVASRIALIQIGVVSEGVDLPIRRLIDLAPSISPVKWLQQFGRITRPSDNPPEYIGTNRNLLRHAYLLEGVLPNAVYVAAEKAFPVSKRAGVRAVGLESLGKLRPANVPLASGATATIYAISEMNGAVRTDFCVLLHPLQEDPIWATRDRGEGSYGKWTRCQPPGELSGFASLPQNAVSEKQINWWKRQAKRYGLDPNAEPTRKNFTALPVLADLQLRFT